MPAKDVSNGALTLKKKEKEENGKEERKEVRLFFR